MLFKLHFIFSVRLNEFLLFYILRMLAMVGGWWINFCVINFLKSVSREKLFSSHFFCWPPKNFPFPAQLAVRSSSFRIKFTAHVFDEPSFIPHTPAEAFSLFLYLSVARWQLWRRGLGEGTPLADKALREVRWKPGRRGSAKFDDGVLSILSAPRF